MPEFTSINGAWVPKDSVSTSNAQPVKEEEPKVEIDLEAAIEEVEEELREETAEEVEEEIDLSDEPLD